MIVFLSPGSRNRLGPACHAMVLPPRLGRAVFPLPNKKQRHVLPWRCLQTLFSALAGNYVVIAMVLCLALPMVLCLALPGGFVAAGC